VTAATARPACANGSAFALSLVSDRGGQPTPVAAAAWFARHGGVAGVPARGWREVGRHGRGATVLSGPIVLHVVQGPDRTWQVDSGNWCSRLVRQAGTTVRTAWRFHPDPRSVGRQTRMFIDGNRPGSLDSRL
jgi:hypothetical protein